MNWNKVYGLSLRHFYLIKSSFPRILDLIYWPSIQIFLWGFISKFFTLSSSYYNNTIGVILSAAILYDFLFRSSISYNMMFLLVLLNSSEQYRETHRQGTRWYTKIKMSYENLKAMVSLEMKFWQLFANMYFLKFYCLDIFLIRSSQMKKICIHNVDGPHHVTDWSQFVDN